MENNSIGNDIISNDILGVTKKEKENVLKIITN